MADPVAEELGGKRKRPSTVTASTSGKEEEEPQKRQKGLTSDNVPTTTPPMLNHVEEGETEAAKGGLGRPSYIGPPAKEDAGKDAGALKKMMRALKTSSNMNLRFSASGTLDSWPLISVLPRESGAWSGDPILVKAPLVFESEQAALIEASDVAPHGQKDKTVVDTSIRNVRVVEPSRLSFWGGEDSGWLTGAALPRKKIATQLGLDPDGIGFVLDKMLVYPEGSFFLAHKDTIKAPGMVATLVVTLPSIYEGGEVIVRHPVDTSKAHTYHGSEYGATWTVWFSDCLHEIKVLASGFRVALAYAVTIADGLPACNLATVPPYLQDLGVALTELGDETWDVVLPLEHKNQRYARSNSRFKGKDRALLASLVAYAKLQRRGLVEGPAISVYTAEVDAELILDELTWEDVEVEYEMSHLLDTERKGGYQGGISLSSFSHLPELPCEPREVDIENTLLSDKSVSGATCYIPFIAPYFGNGSEGFEMTERATVVVISIDHKPHLQPLDDALDDVGSSSTSTTTTSTAPVIVLD